MHGSRRGVVLLGVVALLAILLAELVLLERTESITWDEDDHLYAGYMSLKTGDFGLNPEHPPLVKMLAALPLLRMPLRLPAMQDRFFKSQAFLGGKEFLFKNDADQMLHRARMAAASLTLLLALLVFLAGREMFGTAAGLFALAMLAFDPNQIAHGALVTTDTGITCFLFATVYAFYRYVKRPTYGRLLLVGVAAGLALASKHTGILVFPMLLALAAGEWWMTRHTPVDSAAPRLKLWQHVAALAAVTVMALAVLWAFYGFRWAARPVGLALNPPSAEYIAQLSRPKEARLISMVLRWHLLPESYVVGLADVRMTADGYRSFLLGKCYPQGVWFYFPFAILIKSTLAFIAGLAVALWAVSSGRLKHPREAYFLLLPVVLYLAVAMSSPMNIGVRHVLPIYAFLGVLTAGAAAALVQRKRAWAYVFGVLLVAQVATSLHAYPAYIPYVNEAWGGSKNAWWLMSDSNADWAQQLKATKQYLDRHQIHDCWFVYFGEGVIDTSYYGIPCRALPTADALSVDEKFYDTPAAVDGTVLISAGDLSGFEFGPDELNPYEAFKTIKPAGVIQHSVFVYQGHFEIPAAAALGRVQKAQDLLATGHADEALQAANEAVSLAPRMVSAQAARGDALEKLGRHEEARAAYAQALRLAETIHPEYQVADAERLRKKLGGGSSAK